MQGGQGEQVLDLRAYTALCGDYTVHILEKLDQLPPGARLRVLAPPGEEAQLEEAARSLEEAGIARLVESGSAGDHCYIVLEKAGG